MELTTQSNLQKQVSNAKITQEEARRRLAKAIDDGFRQTSPVLIEALPSIGKSYGVINWAAETGNPLLVLTARHELFDQYVEWCDENGLTALKLPTFHTDCETARGDYGDEWADRIKQSYDERGLLPGELHGVSKKLFGEELPCQRDGECSYFAAREVDTDEYDVLIGHYRHAQVPGRAEGRCVALDEFPDESFLSEYDSTRVVESVESYLRRHDGLRFRYLKDLREYRRNPERNQEAINWFKLNNPEFKRDVDGATARNGNTHPEAPAMVYAIIAAEDLKNRWEYAELPDGRRVVIDPSDETMTVLNLPRLEGAKSVIGLDGTPTLANWRLMLGKNLQHVPVLSDDEKAEFLRDVLNLEIIQTTNGAKHYSGGISVIPKQDLALFEAVQVREQVRPAVISSRRALAKYGAEELSEIVGETEHFGNLKGSNKFATTRVGIVAGSVHYGDDYIKKWAALAGESVSRAEDTKGVGQDFGPYGNQILHGMRENEVLQSVMRFGRDGVGATVYVHTAALPSWVVRDGFAEVWTWPDGMYEILNAIQTIGKREWRTKDISSLVDLSPQQVRDHLHTLVDFGYINRRRESRGYTWSDVSLNSVGKRGHVEFDV